MISSILHTCIIKSLLRNEFIHPVVDSELRISWIESVLRRIVTFVDIEGVIADDLYLIPALLHFNLNIRLRLAFPCLHLPYLRHAFLRKGSRGLQLNIQRFKILERSPLQHLYQPRCLRRVVTCRLKHLEENTESNARYSEQELVEEFIEAVGFRLIEEAFLSKCFYLFPELLDKGLNGMRTLNEQMH